MVGNCHYVGRFGSDGLLVWLVCWLVTSLGPCLNSYVSNGVSRLRDVNLVMTLLRGC